MKQQWVNKKISAGILFCLLTGVTAMAFRDADENKSQPKQAIMDTIPKSNHIEIDINIEELNTIIKNSLAIAEKSLHEINWDKISADVEKAIKEIDTEKIKADVEMALKSIDAEKIKREIDRSSKEIDRKKLKNDIEKEINKALKSINTEELKNNIEKINKTNLEELKKEMENLKKELKKSKEEIKNTTDISFEIEETQSSYKKLFWFYEI